MAKDIVSNEGGPMFNYLPEVFGIKVSETKVEVLASSANWIKAIANYEKEEHNPNATNRGDRTTLKALTGYIDNLDGVTLQNRAETTFAGDRMRGWMLGFERGRG
jgi:hypothetical protein